MCYFWASKRAQWVKKVLDLEPGMPSFIPMTLVIKELTLNKRAILTSTCAIGCSCSRAHTKMLLFKEFTTSLMNAPVC